LIKYDKVRVRKVQKSKHTNKPENKPALSRKTIKPTAGRENRG